MLSLSDGERTMTATGPVEQVLETLAARHRATRSRIADDR
jgi:ribosomal protein L20A (L18A)